MVQAPFFEGLHDSQRIPDGPVSEEGACTSIKTPSGRDDAVLLLEKYAATPRFGGRRLAYRRYA